MYIRIPYGLGKSPEPVIDPEFQTFLLSVDRQTFIVVLGELRSTLNRWIGDYGPSIGQIIIRRALQFLDMAYLKVNSEPNSSNRNRAVESIKTAFEVLGFLKLILIVEVVLKVLTELAIMTALPAGLETKLLGYSLTAVKLAQWAAESRKLKDILTSLSKLLNAAKTLDTLRRAQGFYLENRQTILTLSSPPP